MVTLVAFDPKGVFNGLPYRDDAASEGGTKTELTPLAYPICIIQLRLSRLTRYFLWRENQSIIFTVDP